jgi:hypothetical protein
MFNDFFLKQIAPFDIMSKNVVGPEGPQMTSQYGAYALRAGLARLYALMLLARVPTCTHAQTNKYE